MKYFVWAALAMLAFSPGAAFAKPLTYPGGWQTIAEGSGDMYALLNSYTITPTIGFGVQNEYDREGNYQMHSLAVINRLWRGNYPDAQANLFLQSGIGYARADGGDRESAAAYTGLLADWENRRFYTEYSNRYIQAGDVNKEFTERGRVGVAPYIGEAGDLHTWLIMQVDHHPERDDNFTVTPLVRLFKGSTMVEAGVSDEGEPLFHLMHAF